MKYQSVMYMPWVTVLTAWTTLLNQTRMGLTRTLRRKLDWGTPQGL